MTLIHDLCTYLSEMEETETFFYHLDPVSFYTESSLRIGRWLGDASYSRQAKQPMFKNIGDADRLEGEVAPVLKPPLEKKEEKKEKPLPPPPKENFSDIRQTLSEIIPQLQILPPTPDDKAKEIAKSYLYQNEAAPITLLNCDESEEVSRFLEEVAFSLSLYFLPAKAIKALPLEKEKGWASFLSSPHLRQILISSDKISQYPDLMTHVVQYPHTQESFLGKTPLLILPDLSSYFKDPLLKRSLWDFLCQRCSHLSS